MNKNIKLLIEMLAIWSMDKKVTAAEVKFAAKAFSRTDFFNSRPSREEVEIATNYFLKHANNVVA